MEDVESSDEGESKVTWRIRVNEVVDKVKKWFMPLVTLIICGLSIGFNMDTGAEVNIMDESTFKKLKFKPKLYRCFTKYLKCWKKM